MGNDSTVIVYIGDTAYADFAGASRCVDSAGIAAVIYGVVVIRCQTAGTYRHFSADIETDCTGTVIDGSFVEEYNRCGITGNSICLS